MIERIIELLSGWIPETVNFWGKDRTFKKFGTFVLAIILGIGVSNFGGVKLLTKLGFESKVWFDSLFTGLFLAAGADPIHSSIRWLEEKKEQSKAKTEKDKSKED